MNKIITITAGHSNTDPGACNGKVTEASIAAELRNIIVYYLHEVGIPTRTDGKGQGNLPLGTARQLIAGSAIAVEVHCNAALNKSAGGVEALAHPKHKDICAKICAAIADVMGNKVRGGDGGWKSESSGQHSRLGYVQSGGIVLETFFISNDAELKIWNEKKWLIGKAIAQVLIEHVKE